MLFLSNSGIKVFIEKFSCKLNEDDRKFIPRDAARLAFVLALGFKLTMLLLGVEALRRGFLERIGLIALASSGSMEGCFLLPF